MQHQTVPQTREILAHELAAGMTVIDGTDGPLVVTSVSQDTIGSLLVSFEGMPEPTLYGRLVTVDILAEQVARPGIAAAMTAGRALLAAGWRYGSTTPMADDTTIRTLLHPSGREIHARTVDRDGDDTTTLTMTGLDLTQVADAITGAGLVAPAGQPTDDEIADEIDRAFAEPEPATLGGQLAFQRVLRRLADDIVEYNLPVPTFSLRIGGCVESRADAQAWADFLGVEITMGGTAGTIPVAEKAIKLGDGQYLNLAFQAPSEERPTDPEKAALAARVAELEAQLAEGGDAR